MSTIKSLGVVESNGASEEFYGDSDADENPFEHSSAHGVEAFAPASLDAQPISGDVLAGAEPGERFSVSTTTASGKSSSSMSVGQLPQDHRRRFPQASGPLTFPAIVGQNNPFITSDLRSRAGAGVVAAVSPVDMEDTEVETETETEGETENEDDKVVTYPAYSVTAAGGAEEMAAERSTKEEREWENRIARQVRNARAGKTDSPAVRRLLQKAGFVPASLRKDVWRLLILGRVDAGVGGSTAAEAGIAQRDVLELDAAILSTELDLDNQRVVRVDVERTRPALEQFKRPRVKNMLARVLTHHCKTYGVGYKQGMHEVLAPFVALSDPELPTSDISLSYGAFIKRFLPYAFNKDEEFISLQICFRLFRILLLYHHPRLCRFLDQYQLQPELYATPWFMTLFASSLDLPRLYEVWDFYLYWGDPALHHFVVLAFVMGNADVILKAEEANLPETMCRLSEGMRSVAEVRALVRTAKALMLNTPKSFRKILRSSLYANLSQSQMNLVLNTLQVSSCIPVSAEEVISYILHKNPHRQLDQESDQEGSGACESMKAFDGHPWQASLPPTPMSPPPARGRFEGADRNSRATSPQRVAERAAMRSLRVHRQYIIMDCRPKQEFEACRLAPALHLDPDLLDSPDDLDAKLKEFNPLQGAVHFCLVGAGGDSSADRQRKNNATFDFSGEAMGLLPTSISKGDFSTRLAASPGRGRNSRSDREGDMGDKDGGFNWMGGFSKALAGRAHEVGGGREEGEVGREEDVQVARFVLMLLQYNFPYISHVRGDMSACLRELSTQALDEGGEQNISNGDYHETLHGLLIGSDADRIREELTRCSPEKKSEGLLAGLAKWTKDKGDWKGDSANDAEGGGDGSEGRTRVPSWIGSWDSQATATDRGDVGGKVKGVTEVDAAKPQVHHAPDPKVPTKRGLFGGVLQRFEKSTDAASARGSGRGDGGNVTERINILEPPLPKGEPSTPSRSLRWLKTPKTAAIAPPEADSAVTAAAAGSMPATLGDKTSNAKVDAAAATACATSPFLGAPNASGTTTSTAEVAQDNQAGVVRKASGTWVKPRKGGPPDRLARFWGKVLGVRDDALPDETLPTVGGNGIVSSADVLDVDAEGAEAGKAGRALGRVESGGESASPSAGEVQEERTPLSDNTGARSSGNDPTEAAATAAVATNSTVDTASADISSGDNAGATSTAAASAGATSSNSESTTVTATAVYPTTTATVDALPIAVAVAIPVVEGGGTRSNPSRPARRPSRRGSRGAAGGAGAGATVERRQEEEAAAAGAGGEAVLISQWVGREERESGGSVRIFSAQRVLEGKVRKRCRLAVSPKNMVQFDNIRQGDGGARGVISEHRGLRYLSRITSRKKHADLLVFHFKSCSDAAAGSGATGSSFGGAGAVSGSSRRSRVRTASENDPGQPDVLFYLLKEHVECLRMVKENYRKVTQGSTRSGDGRNDGGNGDVAPNTSSQDSRSRASPNRSDEQRSSRAGRQAVRAAGAVAGATGLVVGATAGVAVGAAAGVAAGAAFLVGHRKGVREELMPRSTSPSRPRRRGSAASGGSDGGGRSRTRANASADVELRRDSGGWIPIDTPVGWIPIESQVETRPRRTDVSGGIGGGSRPSAVTGGLRPSSSTRNPRSQNGVSQEQRRSTRGGGATGGAGEGRGATDGPTWLDRG